MAKKPTGGGKPPTPRDSGKQATSIAGRILAGGTPTAEEARIMAGSILSQNQRP